LIYTVPVPVLLGVTLVLGELVRLMERLQTRLEETASPVEAVSKVSKPYQK